MKKITPRQLRNLVKEELSSVQQGRRQVEQLGIAVADSATLALIDEMKDMGKELPKDISQGFHDSVAKQVRQLVKNMFYQYPDWD